LIEHPAGRYRIPPARAGNESPSFDVFWTRPLAAPYDRQPGVIRSTRNPSMVAVIGNVIAGLLAVSLFTATVRLSK